MSILQEITNKKKLTPDEKERQIKIEAGRHSFWEYCKLINPIFFNKDRTYQKVIADTMQMLYEKKLINPRTKKLYDILIVNLPPGFGKSYMATTFTTWAFGQDSKNMAITVSYNQTLSTRFAKTVRDTIEDEEIEIDKEHFVVNSFFPDLKIKQGDGAMNLWSLEGSYMSYLASSFDGSITGMRGNIGIIDDPIKNAEEAVNDNVKNKHWEFYKNTFSSRMLEGACQIIIQTRWATDDLAGRLLKEFPDRCYELKMKALDENNKSLCEDLYSTEDLLKKKETIDDNIWRANYQQEPIDLQGSLYPQFKTYSFIPEFEKIYNYTDTADEGIDYLCSISFGEFGSQAYILDVYYTQDGMEKTEPETARRLNMYDVRGAAIESNNGGRGFARNVQRILKDRYNNRKCKVKWFHQSKNKMARILVNSNNVTEDVLMPEDWKKRWPEFADHILKFQAKGKNKHDDCADALTGVVEILLGEVKAGGSLSILR